MGLCTTDLVSARGLLNGSRKSLQLIETCPDDSPLAVQLFGQHSAEMREAAQLLQERGIDAVDINMGCPVVRVTGVGAGSALLCRPEQTIRLVQAVVEGVTIPVTVKMRLGWDETQLTAPFFAREFEQVGVAAVAIHGRTRAQGFSGSVNREGIRQVVEAVERIPVIGNGDIRTVEDAQTMFRETGCQGISIGRGALANPWIFRQLVEWELHGAYGPAGGFAERLALMKQQLSYYQLQVGEREAIRLFRRTAHWYLKGMGVRAALRHRYQLAEDRQEVERVLEEILKAGPVGSRVGERGESLAISVPAGPNAHW